MVAETAACLGPLILENVHPRKRSMTKHMEDVDEGA
jgi:hypothetical protein